jgi:hypothetical protein
MLRIQDQPSHNQAKLRLENELETIKGPRVPGLTLAVWKMKVSDVKCPNAMRYVKSAISYTLPANM